MTVIKDKFKITIKSFINESSGFTLVEIMIAVLIIGIVLSMGFMLFLFGISSQQIGEDQADVQQNARLVGDFISKELRMAEKCDILLDYDKDLTPEELKIFLGGDDEYPEDDGIGYDFEEDHLVYFIFEHEGSIYYQEVSDLTPETELLEGISRNIDFDLEFKLGDKDNTVEIEIYATDKQTGRSYYLETEVLVLNVDQIAVDETIADGDGGTAIVYQIPAPPSASIKRVTISPTGQDYNDIGDINVNVQTDRIVDDATVTATVRKRDRENDIAGPVVDQILDDKANITILSSTLPDFPAEGLYFGDDYYVEIEISGISSPRKRFFSILPVVDILELVDVLGNPHVDITIETYGVQEGTPVELVQEDYPEENEAFEGNELFIALIERTGEGYEYLEIVHQSGDNTVNANGEVTFTARIDSDYGSDDNLYVRAKIGGYEWVERELTTLVAGLDALEVSEGDLVPDFHGEEANYSVEVGHGVGEIDVTATLEDAENDSLTIDGEVASSGEQKTVSLNGPGEKTKIDIVVTREDEDTTMEYVYTIEVTRLEEEE